MPIFYVTAPRNDENSRISHQMWKLIKSKRVKSEIQTDSQIVKVSIPFRGKDDIQLGLDVLTAWNLLQMKHHEVPHVYKAGVHYQREVLCEHNGKVGICEEWLTADEIIRRGAADCEDLGPYLAACYRRDGVQAAAFPMRSSVGWHIQVRLPDGTIEDPSAVLGMPTA